MINNFFSWVAMIYLFSIHSVRIHVKYSDEYTVYVNISIVFLNENKYVLILICVSVNKVKDQWSLTFLTTGFKSCLKCHGFLQ